MIKLVAIDLDGTLLSSNHTISELNQKAIKRAEEKDIKIVLCSGRTIHSVLGFAKDIGIQGKHDYLVGYNGAGALRIHDEKVIYNQSLNGRDAPFIATICAEVDANYTVHTFSDSMTPRQNPHSTLESALNGVELFIKHPRELNNEDQVTKVLILDDPEILDGYEEYIREQLKDYHVVKTMPIYLEVLKKGINKYSGIMAVADLYNIKKEEIMAMGDALNDLEIIKEAGIGVAMENAKDSVKDHADFVTISNDEDGVAYAMNQFLDLGLDDYFKEVYH